MANKDRILSVLTTAEICDDCLSELSSIHPRQAVYSICSSLSDESAIMRFHGKCNQCHKVKLVSRLYDNSPPKNEAAESRPAFTSEPSETPAWFWGGSVQRKVIEYLVQHDYVIRSVTDIASRTHGKNIVAIAPDGNELWVSVKGYPEKSSNVQARHWFSGAVFDLLLYRGENPNVKLALAFPDGFVTYTNLLPRIDWLKQTIPFEVFWVSEDGSVQKE